MPRCTSLFRWLERTVTLEWGSCRCAWTGAYCRFVSGCISKCFVTSVPGHARQPHTRAHMRASAYSRMRARAPPIQSNIMARSRQLFPRLPGFLGFGGGLAWMHKSSRNRPAPWTLGFFAPVLRRPLCAQGTIDFLKKHLTKHVLNTQSLPGCSPRCLGLWGQSGQG